jgi:hypothetical protein
MRQAVDIVNLLPAIPLLLVHLAGVVVAIILLVRQQKRRIPAVLALIGFGLLFVLDGANFARAPLINFASHQTGVGVRSVVTSVGCCCSVFDVAATTCLIIAIWQALSRANR